jgi:hypothetical protein
MFIKFSLAKNPQFYQRELAVEVEPSQLRRGRNYLYLRRIAIQH